jgi:LPXTG-site transpeptidase (sortase) family protein
LLALVLVALVAAAVLARREDEPQNRTDASAAVPDRPASGANRAVAEPDKRARARDRRVQMPAPVRISIPAISVSAPVIPLGLNPDRTLEVPTDFGDTGWFTEGPEPGETGAALIVGHLDSQAGPAVFYRLSALQPGDRIEITLKNGSTVRYVARWSKTVRKSEFPTKLVYARTKQPTLRLVTCAGELDEATGRHPDNYIVFATLA